MIATIITGLALVGVGVMVGFSHLRGGKVAATGAGYFALVCFALTAWLLANVLSDVDTSRALLWVRVSFASVAVAVISFLLFVNRFPVARSVSYFETVAHRCLFVIMIAVIWSPLMIPEVTFSGSVATVVPGPLYGVFIGYVVYLLSFALIRLAKSAQAKKRHRAQAQLILTGTLVTAIAAISTNLLLPLAIGNNDLYWLASVSTLAFVVATAFAIVKEGMFDVRHAVVRSVTYMMSLAIIVGVYYILVYLVSHFLFDDREIVDGGIRALNVVLPALILTVMFHPVKAFFDQVTDKLFFKANYRSVDFISRLNSLLGSTTNLRGMLDRVSNEIAATLKSEQVFFFLRGEAPDNRYMMSGTKRHATMLLSDIRQLDEHMMQSGRRGVFLVDTISDDARAVRRMLTKRQIELVIPLNSTTGTLGYLFLGDHRSGNYTKRDLAVLATISNELVIAIQNAVSLYELQELNATLQQRIDVATKELRSSNAQLKHLDEVKDEFMSMASHQLRTPLTSIKGYLSMVLEGDAGQVAPQQRKLLQEAYKSSERMVGLIADFLNVSRLQTGKFVIDKTPFDMKDIVRQEVDDLQLIAETHDIKLRAKLAAGTFPVLADEQKLRQVIMNFIDNAVYYSHPKSTVIVNIERIKGMAAVTIVDTGIGVPAKEQPRLFNKFFRAGNARKRRPDGTGVGLYLARKVVTAHKGAIIFSSTENKGSTFGFRIPLVEPEKSTK